MLDRPSPLRMDKLAFLDWVDGREGRYELTGGQVQVMVGASRAHGAIVANVLGALRGRLDRKQWIVLADFGVEAGLNTLRYPDLIVEPHGGSWKDRTAREPVLAVEILSPTTATTDLGDKAAEYLSLPTLVAYAVLSQDECKGWLWLRAQSDFTPRPQVLTGRQASVEVPALSLHLPLADVYADIDFE